MLIPCEYRDLCQYKSAASKEHVSVSDTNRTRWFRTEDRTGFCALIEIGDSLRVKGVFVHREYRGTGIGSRMTDELLTLASSSGKRLQVLAYNRAFYELRGFKVHGQLPNGAWKLERLPSGNGQPFREQP